MITHLFLFKAQKFTSKNRHISKNIELKPRLLALATQPEVFKEKDVLLAECEKKHTLTSIIKSINFDHAITRTMVKAGKRKLSSPHKKGRGVGTQAFLVPNLALVTYLTKNAALRPSTWLNFALY